MLYILLIDLDRVLAGVYGGNYGQTQNQPSTNTYSLSENTSGETDGSALDYMVSRMPKNSNADVPEVVPAQSAGGETPLDKVYAGMQQSKEEIPTTPEEYAQVMVNVGDTSYGDRSYAPRK